MTTEEQLDTTQKGLAIAKWILIFGALILGVGAIGLVLLRRGFTREFRSKAVAAISSVQKCSSSAAEQRVPDDICPFAKLAVSQLKIAARSKADSDAADLIAEYEYHAELRAITLETLSVREQSCLIGAMAYPRRCIEKAEIKDEPEKNKWSPIESQMRSLADALEDDRPSALTELMKFKEQRTADLIKEANTQMAGKAAQ